LLRAIRSYQESECRYPFGEPSSARLWRALGRKGNAAWLSQVGPGGRWMRVGAWQWLLGGVVLSVVAGLGTARADTVYFKNGTSMWGEFAEIEGDEVVIHQPGRTIRFPRDDVARIEKIKTNLPDHPVNLAPPPAPLAPSGSTVTPGGSPGGPTSSPSGSSGSRGSRRY
jgi:hypothetical protein